MGTMCGLQLLAQHFAQPCDLEICERGRSLSMVELEKVSWLEAGGYSGSPWSVTRTKVERQGLNAQIPQRAGTAENDRQERSTAIPQNQNVVCGRG